MSKDTEKNKKSGLKEFGLTSLAVDNATSIFILAFMVFLFGLYSYTSVPKESFPEIPWPKIYINTVYFGNSAKDIENLITRPIEKELASVSEIKDITSSSLQDYSLIVAEFDSDVDIDDATRKVKDAVDKAKPELPTDLTKEPEVLDINMSEIPIMTVNISGNYSNDELKEYAEYLEDEFEDLKEISKVDLKGDLEREVKIEVDLPKMQSMQVAFSDIENAIKQENLTMSGGELLNNDFRRNIRIIGEFSNPKQIENIIVKSERQNPVFLKDFANVVYGYKEKTSIARADLLPVISLDIIKRSGENLLNASDEIKAIIAKAEKDVFPQDLSVTIFNDQSVQTRSMVSNLENSIISGVILVVLVLLFFLGIRNAMFVGVAIPLSMLMGFLIINVIGYSLNMVILFGLILALGMLVDNAIVVVENIYRYMQNGYSGWDAAKYGTGEVAIPIIASTATTLAAFVPLAFWPGLMGSFMKFLPITLIIVLTSSLFVALVINPVLTATFMKVDEKAATASERQRKKKNVLIGVGVMVVLSIVFHFAGVMWLRNILWISAAISLLNIFFLRPASFYFQNRLLPVLENAYDKFIHFSLKGINPYLVFGGTGLLLVVSLMLLGANMPKVDLFPDTAPNYVNAFVELPMGKDISATDETMKELEVKIKEVIEPYDEVVDAVLAQIGENTSDPNGGPDFSASPNKARLSVAFVPSEERGDVDTWDIMADIREEIKGIPGVQIVVDKDASGPPTGKPINIELSGDDINELALLSDEMVDFINSKNIYGIEELKKDVNIGKPELIVNIDREAARRYEVSTYAIGDAIRTAVFGKEVSKYKEGDDDFPIVIRAKDRYRYNIDQVLNQVITFRSMATGKIVQVPISSVADIDYSSTYNSINRKDQQRVITIYSNVLKDANPNEVVNEIKLVLNDFKMPDGYTYDFTGQQEEQEENMSFLGGALGVALFAILLILVAQFNSISAPVIILISVLFSTIGVFLGYVFTGMDILIVMTGVGIISLAGIVVNNAIVLIDYTNLTIKRKVEENDLKDERDLDTVSIKNAIVLAGATRLRPVLLTAITTVLGLIPLAIGFNFNFFTFITDLDGQIFIGGDNADFWGAMAWTVVYGLTFSTFLTLVVVPVMYWLSFLLKRKVRRTVA
ncbi:MAG: efflux RND transporter permease subunit [Saprospiraceae bacterium]